MAEFNYDSYCGVYCGACSIHQAYRTGHKDALANYYTEENIKAYLEQREYPLSAEESLEFKCHGCKSDTVFINCRPCRIRNCAIEKKIEHCIDCADFPCEYIKEGILNIEVVKHLPHLMAAPKNLLTIKHKGLKKWQDQQEKLWNCPKCGKQTSWYAVKCPNCGKDLKKRKDYLKK